MRLQTLDEVMACSEALAERLAARATAAEELRRLPDETMADLLDSGLLPMVVPTGLGGSGLGLDALAHSTRILAHGCPASAWTISFLVMHSWLLARFPAAARAELFTPDKPWALAPAPLAPTGTAKPADGGYRISGRWEWATGVCHAEWVLVHAVEDGPDLATRFALVPRDEVVVEDVWFMSGMCATGSNTVHLDDVFVPAHRTLPAMELLLGGESIEGDGLRGLPVIQVLAVVAAAPALGAAEEAVRLFRERMSERVLAYTLGERQKDAPPAHVRLGTAMSDLASARARWEHAVSTCASAAPAGGLSDEQRVGVRLSAAATVRGARSVIGTVCEGSGASVYQSTAPLQRLQRDVEVLKGHVVFDWDRVAELAGRVALGLPLRPTDMA